LASHLRFHALIVLVTLVALPFGAVGCAETPTDPAPSFGDFAKRRDGMTSVSVTSDIVGRSGGLPIFRLRTVATFTATGTGGQTPYEFRWIANGLVVRGWNQDPVFRWNGYLPDGTNMATAPGYLYFRAEGRGTHQTTRSISLPFSEAVALYNIEIANCSDPNTHLAICL
jgi:hypothetical protein